MKSPKEEIYLIRYNKLVTKDDILFSNYTLDVPVLSNGQTTKVNRIEIKDEKWVVVSFENGNKHQFVFNDGVEIYSRPVQTDKK